MSKAALSSSLALWRRRLKWNQRQLLRAHRRHDKALVHKHGARVAVCVGKINEIKHKIAVIDSRRLRSARAKCVDVARSYVGVSENPPGSNRGKFVSEWQTMFLGGAGYPWCGCFAGAMLVKAGVRGVSSRIASVGLIEDDARAGRAPFRSWSSSARGALRGDLVVIGGYGVHVEIVAEVLKDGSVLTIGGNTSPGSAGSQSNGGCVAARHRSVGEVHGVAHVDFPGK